MTTQTIAYRPAQPSVNDMIRGARGIGTVVLAFIVSAVMAAALAIGAVYKDERGDIKTSIGAVVGGVLTIVIGLVLSNVILSQAAAAGSSTNIASFSGAQALNDLVPLIYYAVVVLIGVGLMGIGAKGIAGST